MQALVRKFNPWFAVTRACQVNLRSKDGQVVSKGWKLMTTSPCLATVPLCVDGSTCPVRRSACPSECLLYSRVCHEGM